MSFAHLTIATDDVEGTSQFFQEVMGWASLRRPGNIEVDADWLEITSGQQLHILGIANCPAPTDEEFGRHYAFFHESNDYDAVQERLRSRGVEIIAAIRPTPFRRFFFRDPNGYLFELIHAGEYQTET